MLLRGLDGQLRRGAPPLQMAGVAGIAGLSATMLLVLLPLAAAHAGHSHLGHDHSKCGTAASGEMLRQLNESRHAWESTLPPNAAETLRREDELDDRLKERRRLQHEAEPDWSDCTGRSAFVPREVYSPSAGEVYVIRTIIHIVHDGIIGLINERVVRRMVEMTNALHVRKFNTKIQFVLLETLYHDQPSWYQDNYHGEYGARECRNVLCERRDTDRHLNIFVYGARCSNCGQYRPCCQFAASRCAFTMCRQYSQTHSSSRLQALHGWMPRRPTPYILAFHRYGVPGITDESGREVGLAGFTWVPFYGTKGSLWDGVHISSESFAFDHNRQHPFTMVHEVAHYLGLQVLRRFRDASEASHAHTQSHLSSLPDNCWRHPEPILSRLLAPRPCSTPLERELVRRLAKAPAAPLLPPHPPSSPLLRPIARHSEPGKRPRRSPAAF